MLLGDLKPLKPLPQKYISSLPRHRNRKRRKELRKKKEQFAWEVVSIPGKVFQVAFLVSTLHHRGWPPKREASSLLSNDEGRYAGGIPEAESPSHTRPTGRIVLGPPDDWRSRGHLRWGASSGSLPLHRCQRRGTSRGTCCEKSSLHLSVLAPPDEWILGYEPGLRCSIDIE